MVFSDVVQSKCIDLVHAAKNAQLNLDFPQFLLHLLVQSQYLKFVSFVHEKIAYADVFFTLLFGFAFAPPNQFHVKCTYLHHILNATVSEAYLQIIAFSADGFKHPLVVQKFEVFCFLFIYVGYVL